MTHPKIIEHRQNKSLMDLALRREKARRKGHWTVEDIDYAVVHGRELSDFLARGKPQHTNP